MARKHRSRGPKVHNTVSNALAKNNPATFLAGMEDLSLATRPWQTWLPIEIQHRVLHEFISSTLQHEAMQNATGEPTPIDCGSQLRSLDQRFEDRVQSIIGPLASFPHLLEEAKKQAEHVLQQVPVAIKFGEGCWEHGAQFDGNFLLRLRTSLSSPVCLQNIQHLRVDIRTTYPGRMIQRFEDFARRLGDWIENLKGTGRLPKLTSLWICVPAARSDTKIVSVDNVDQHFLVTQLVISMRQLNLKSIRILVNTSCGGLSTPWRAEMKEEGSYTVADSVCGMTKMGDFAVWI